uniref:Translation initiation factor IF-3 n=1 Tax=Cajanus cajan TaxID=3821 RepID=A0A151TQ76_CAJCA|nr:Translation initiation factor IF-3 [Cajanus cajan]
MAFWHRIRNPNLKTLSIQFQRCYIRLPHASTPKPCPINIPHPYSVFHRRPSSVRFFAAPVQVKPKDEEEDSDEYRLNDKIKATYIRLVRDDGQHSILPKFEALELAKELKLDLVEVDRSAKPPVCKIMDYHKEMYKRQEWEKERAKSKANMTLRKDNKEVRFSAKTEARDLKVKADMIRKLAEKGYRVMCKISAKENQDLTEVFSPLLALIEDVCVVESGPHMAKKDAHMLVRHIKFGLPKKGGKKGQDATQVKMETSTASSSDSIEDKSHTESGFETEKVPSDGDKFSKSSWPVFNNSVNMTASPDYQTNAAPEEAVFMSRSNDPVSHPAPENRYRRAVHHGENQVQSNAAVAENRYKRVEPRSRFQQTPNNTGMNYQGPGTRDAVRSTTHPNWNRPSHAPVNVDPRIENNRQGFNPGSRHPMPPHENFSKHPPFAPNTPRPGYGNFSASNEGIPRHPGAPNTTRPSSYGNFSTPKGPETQGVNLGMHRSREGNQ